MVVQIVTARRITHGRALIGYSDQLAGKLRTTAEGRRPLFVFVTENFQVTLVTGCRNHSRSNGCLDTAANLVVVQAVREAAVAYKRAELDEEALDLFANHVPQPQLTNAGRIDDPASIFEAFKHCGARGMPAFSRIVGDAGSFQPQPGLNGVQQRRFANARLPTEDRLSAENASTQSVDARSCFGGNQKDIIPEIRVLTDDRLHLAGVDQVCFVNADQRLHAPFFAADEKSIDKTGLEVGGNCGDDDGGQLHVGDNQLLRPSAASSQCARTWLDAMDHALQAGRGFEENAIARDNGIAIILAERAQNLPDSADINFVVWALNPALMRPNDGQHTADVAAFRIDIERNLFAAILFVFDGNDGPFAGQFPFAGNTLVALQLVEIVLLEGLPQFVATTRAFAAILLEVNADLSLFRHAAASFHAKFRRHREEANTSKTSGDRHSRMQINRPTATA